MSIFNINCNKALVNQRRRRVVITKIGKSLLSTLQLTISQISTKKYGHCKEIEIARKCRPIGGRLRNHSDQSEHVVRILKLYFCFSSKE